MIDFRNRHCGRPYPCASGLSGPRSPAVHRRPARGRPRHHSSREAAPCCARPDVIMLGEIRDAATMQHALHYAETGHQPRHPCRPPAAATPSGASCASSPTRAQTGAGKPSHNLLAVVGQRLVPGLAEARGGGELDARHALYPRPGSRRTGSSCSEPPRARARGPADLQPAPVRPWSEGKRIGLAEASEVRRLTHRP